MILIRDFNELSHFQKPIHWAMGVFDGLHIGHRAVIESAVNDARNQRGIAGVLTFDNHPLSCLCPELAPLRLWGDEQDKSRLLKEWGVDVELSLVFDGNLAAMTAEVFLKTLNRYGSLASISVGEDWRFGSNRRGDLDFLRREGAEQGFGVHSVAHVFWNGERVSSTRIRKAVAAGDFESATSMLGRPYAIEGKVVHGRGLARQLGFPTANIRPMNGQLPPFGVYAVRVRLDEKELLGMANLGVRPTVEQESGELLLETHLFDCSDDLYGKRLSVELLHFLRSERKFDSLGLLKLQIADDAKLARKVLFERN